MTKAKKINGIELTEDEIQGYVQLEGRLVFSDLIEPGGAPGFAPKYSATIQTSKTSGTLPRLFAVMTHVAQTVWGDGVALERLQQIQDDLEEGVSPKKALCSITDGDAVQPEYNAGTYVIKASRRLDQGRPVLMNTDGVPLIASDGEWSRPADEAPKPGDGVLLVCRVWAQKKFDRINFTVEGVRKAIPGKALSGGNPEQAKAAISALASAPLPTSLSAVEPAKQVTAQAEPEPAPAPAPTSAKRTSLFRS